MRQVDLWRPTKFAMVGGRLRGDRTGSHLSVGSRIAGDWTAPRYQDALRKCARGRLLDLGCGNAPLFHVYRDLVEDTVCIDWPASLHNQKHVDVFADLTRPLPLRDETFDTVLLSDVLEHIPNPESLIAEIARVLRPGGSAVIGVPFLYPLHEIPYDFNRYTRYQLERMLGNAGLEVVELVAIGGSPVVIADLLSKTLAGRPAVAAAFVKIAGWVLRRGFMQKISQRNRDRFPIAYIAVGTKARTA